MEENRRLIREHRLRKFVRLLSGQYDIGFCLPKNGNRKPLLFDIIKGKPKYYGYSTENDIYVNPDLDKEKCQNLILQKAVSLHELGHVLYTDGEKWQESDVSHGLMNIIEDGRVEESISREYPRGRNYLFTLNNEINQQQPSLAQIFSLEAQTAEFILRTAKLTTGLEPNYRLEEKLKKKLKDDYYWLGSKTREAVEAKTEDEAIKITQEIQKKWEKLFKKKNFPSIAGTPHSSITSKQKRRKKAKKQPPTPPSGSLHQDKVKNIQKQAQKRFDKNSKKQNEKEEEKRIKKSIEEQKKDQEEIGKKCKKSNQQGAQQEVHEETKEDMNGNAKGNFDDYEKLKKQSDENKGDPVNLKPLIPVARRLSREFFIILQAKDVWKRHRTRGKIDTHSLYKVPITKRNTPRVFKKRIKDKGKDISVAILIDISGSMDGRDVETIQSSYVVSKALEFAEFKSEIVAFGAERTGTYKGLVGYKSFDQPLKYAESSFCARAENGTPLYPALVGAEKSLQKVNTLKKMCFVITDGDPNTGGGPEDCKNKIREMERQGIKVFGILIQANDTYGIFSKRIRCDNPYDLPTKMKEPIKRLLREISR